MWRPLGIDPLHHPLLLLQGLPVDGEISSLWNLGPAAFLTVWFRSPDRQCQLVAWQLVDETSLGIGLFVRYIGSKLPLLEDIYATVSRFDVPDGSHFVDIFSGTGSVAQRFRSQFSVTTNDLLYFNYAIARGTVVPTSTPRLEKLGAELDQDPFDFLETSSEILDAVVDRPLVLEEFSPAGTAGRRYFTEENALRIDAIRTELERWRQARLVDEEEYFFLLATLIRSIPSVASIAGTFGAYLKNWDKRALRPLRLERIELEATMFGGKAFNSDANALISLVQGDVLYLDPPYNSRQYVSNYHVLETIALYDDCVLKGVTGLRDTHEGKSRYCRKGQVGDALRQLVLGAQFDYLVMSYSSEGLLSLREISDILGERVIADSFEIRELDHRRYKRIAGTGSDKVTEYLVSGALT